MVAQKSLSRSFSPATAGEKKADEGGFPGSLRGPLLFAACFLLLVPTIASACPVCYGQPGSPITDGARNGVLFLLGVIGSVQIGFVALFFSFWKKAKAAREKREQFTLIQGGVSPESAAGRPEEG